LSEKRPGSPVVSVTNGVTTSGWMVMGMVAVDGTKAPTWVL
jgi:hypothetical protein